MEYDYNDFVDEHLVDECDQIRAIAKKSWLTGAAVSLAHLDNVKTNVYNFGIADPRDLKATNLRNRKPKPPGTDNLSTEPPLSATSSQINNVAWGSNSSIPDLLRQQNAEKPPLVKPTRPGSAKYSNTRIRPPSGKKPRPQSAKEPVTDIVSQDATPGFGVKGAKYDPNGRPPKGVPNVTTTGWVGPPAGLKYPDKPPPGAGWKIEFPEEPEADSADPTHILDREVPPPPCTTPMPPTPEPEKPKRVFELYIGDPYKVDGQDDEDLYEDSDEELEFVTSTHHTEHPHYAESSGNFNNSYNDQATPPLGCPTPSTGMADQRECLKLNLPIADDDFDEMDEVDTDRLLAEAESVSKNLDLKSIINVNKNIPVPSSQDTNYSDHSEKQPESSHDVVTRKKAESLVNTIINENGLAFDKNRMNAEINDKHLKEHDKSSVKFNEDITTVNITPRNLGRKVDEIHNKKKAFPTKDTGFIDLIEVKNRMEPVLATTKMDMSPRRTKPPLGKARTGKSAVTVGLGGVGKHADNKSDRSFSPTGCLRNKVIESHTKSREPLNRAPKPITTVTVDYGEEETREKMVKQKKKRKKSEEILSMMERINLQDNRNRVPVPNLQDFDSKDEDVSETVYETRCKSEPMKNYYEISRHSSMSNRSVKDDVVEKGPVISSVLSTQGNTVFKTTKTIEFDDEKPKEVTVKSVLDAQVVKETKQYIVKPPSRPSSAKPPQKKPVQTEPEAVPERPGSRLGFVAMTPSGNSETQTKTRTHTRPWSAPVHKRPMSAHKSKPKSEKKDTNTTADGQEVTDREKAEREKVIDNLLERTRGLLENGERKDIEEELPKEEVKVEKRKARPASAHVGLALRTKDSQTRVKSAVNRRPASASTTRDNCKHYANYSTSSTTTRSRKSSSKSSKVIQKEPCIITSNIPYLDEESETEEDLACQEMHNQLANRGVNIAADTLQRALYPPSGRTKYYHINADLPKKSSISLLSHPKIWLTEEYNRLQKAEKTLARANEIMFLQEKAEKRRAMLAGLGPEEKKKLLQKKKGKKGAKKLRRSKTIA